MVSPSPRRPAAAARLGRAFFARPATDLAAELVGAIMVRRVRGVVRRARVVEVEAYLGPPDLAAHAAKGRTARTEVIFGPPGHAYVYFVYGLHWMLNIVAGAPGDAHAVLLRGAEPLDGWTADLGGPARLARGFGIGARDYGLDVTGRDLFFVADPGYEPRIVRTKRIGVEYARRWKDARLRFVDVRSGAANLAYCPARPRQGAPRQ